MPRDSSAVHLASNIPAGGSLPRATPGAEALAARVSRLNDRYRHHGAIAVLEAALTDPDNGRLALVSSFGAESVVLLHMVALIDRQTPVLFLDTEMLFTETLLYQQEVAERLGLEQLHILRPDADELHARDPQGQLHLEDPDACCALRKTRPLADALAGFDGWISGRKRFQGGQRADLEFFELEAEFARLKVNPLARWSPDNIRTYIEENRLPRHPLVAQGYPSIGCLPCTSPVKPGEDPRAGRWRGQQKQECGIHFVNGKMIRKGETV